MTNYQEFMLSVCFGATLGYLIAGFGMMLFSFIHFVKDKIKAHKEKKNQQIVEDNEKVSEGQ